MVSGELAHVPKYLKDDVNWPAPSVVNPINVYVLSYKGSANWPDTSVCYVFFIMCMKVEIKKYYYY